MHTGLHALALILLTLPAPGDAQDRRPLREARSENGRYRLRIDAGREESRRCRAALFEHTRPQERGRRLWREKLVNEVAPRHALIRNDGRFVITLDEFRRGGAAHAVVVYDERGELLREFDLRELLHGDDWKHVTAERRAIEWLSDATLTFVDSPPQFVIKLEWSREIRIDLEEIELVGKRPRSDHPASKPADREKTGSAGVPLDPAIPPEILALLEQPTSAPAGDGKATTESTTMEAILLALAKLQQLASASGVDVDVAGAIATPLA